MLIGEFYEKVFQLSDETLIQKLMQMTEISFFKKGKLSSVRMKLQARFIFCSTVCSEDSFSMRMEKKSRIALVLKQVRRPFPVWESGILLPLPWKR